MSWGRRFAQWLVGAALATGVLVAPLPVHAQGPELEQAAATVRPAVVRISYVVFETDPLGRVRRSTSVGSGIIFDRRGYIATNAHVVERSSGTVTVDLIDGRRLEGVVIGMDRYTDVAVVQVSAPDLPVAKWGDSSSLVPGQPVVVIGHTPLLDRPYEGRPGVVLGLDGSTIMISGSVHRELIRSSIELYPGDSGGALLDAAGNVVGMNVMRRRDDPSGTWNEFLHIPSNRVQTIANLLVLHGKIARPFLGVYVSTLTPQGASRLGLRHSRGAYIEALVPAGPAGRAGLVEGDTIIAIEGMPVRSREDLQLALDRLLPGQTVTVEVIRSNGMPEAILVTVGERP
ncbi:MAG: trypsin-like peptidase domain-containing protein [Chloroflexota bacterium]|nr:S1C family serine protease [Dehalococcoidia bacterium]MDW8253599.1 trypsin-like peptidase domain-containing protein [Chloroflexota bacterium]